MVEQLRTSHTLIDGSAYLGSQEWVFRIRIND